METHRAIRSVAVVDDSELVRQSYGDALYDMHKEVLDLAGPIKDLETGIRQVDSADAVICDHQLEGYASFSGAEFAAALYRIKKPAILCTQFWRARSNELVIHREWLPTILQPPPEPHEIQAAIDECLREFSGQFSEARRPWRTLIRVENVKRYTDHEVVEMVIPAWNPHQVVARPITLIPAGLRERLVEEATPVRLHAEVNIQAEDADELFFREWEVP